MAERNDTAVVYTRDVAAMLGMSIAHVNQLAATGALPILAKAPGLRGANVFDLREVEKIAPHIRQRGETGLDLSLPPYSALADLAKSLEAQLASAPSLGEALAIRRDLDKVRAEQSRRNDEDEVGR